MFFMNKLADVLQHVAREHGLPNYIGPDEIAYLFNAPSVAACRMKVGRVFRRDREELNACLVGMRVTEYVRCPDGRMAAKIEACPE